MLARHRHLSATARAPWGNHGAVAGRPAQLETALENKLFERRSTGYQLTAAGRRALEPAAAMENAAGALGRLGPEPSLAGLIRVTATPSLAETFLIPRLKALHKLHPALDFEILAERKS